MGLLIRMTRGLKLETHDGEQYIIGPKSLVIFADETGSDSLADPSYPVFGLGCCSLLSRDHGQSISHPWRELKKRIFGEERHPFHAADLPRLRPEDIAYLARYLRHAPFDRSAVAMTTKTLLNLDAWVLAARYMIQSTVNLAQAGTYAEIVLIAERGQEKKWRKAVEGWSSKVPAAVQFLEKSPVNHGIEIADLIATIWGRHARRTHGHGDGPDPDIYGSIFMPELPGRAKAIVLDSAHLNEG